MSSSFLRKLFVESAIIGSDPTKSSHAISTTDTTTLQRIEVSVCCVHGPFVGDRLAQKRIIIDKCDEPVDWLHETEAMFQRQKILTSIDSTHLERMSSAKRI